MKLRELSTKLSNLLAIDDFSNVDISLNGLQVGDLNSNVEKVAFAVDANMESIKGAIDCGANMLFVHHGMYWGKPFAITDYHYDKIKTLLDNNLALFACHLPLDAHLELGNNVQMAKKLSLINIEPFSFYKGKYVGVKGRFKEAMLPNAVIDALGVRRNARTTIIGDGQKRIKTIGIVSGDGAFDMYEALQDGLDALITGEARYSTYNDCIEAGFTMLCLGHYETETFGVKAVMQEVSKMGLKTCFIDTHIQI